MGRSILAYVAVFLFTGYCFFIYDDSILSTMLIIEIIYFLISVIYLLKIKSRLQISLEPLLTMSEKNKEIPITISIKNKMKYIPTGVVAVITIENIFSGEKSKHRIHGKVNGCDAAKLKFYLTVKECGNIKITLHKIIVYDMLFILRRDIQIKHTEFIGVLPESHLIPIDITRKTREFIADSEEYSDRESGDDPTELYQIREYREKDSVHDIHWKLSAKMDEILVKEHGKPLGCVVLLWLDLSSEQRFMSGNKNITDIISKMKKIRYDGKKTISTDLLELTASISLSLLEEKCVHFVAWYEPNNKIIQGKRVSREEHLYELLSRFLYLNIYKKNDEVDVLYQEIFKGVNFSTIVKLNSKAEITVNEKKILIPREHEKIKWDELYFQV